MISSFIIDGSIIKHDRRYSSTFPIESERNSGSSHTKIWVSSHLDIFKLYFNCNGFENNRIFLYYFSFEMISKMVPDKYEKVLKNIRKLQARKAKKKASLLDSEKEDMDVGHSTKKSTAE